MAAFFVPARISFSNEEVQASSAIPTSTPEVVVASTTPEALPAANAPIQLPPSVPLHIVIPTGEVNASIIPVGITKQGNLDTPHNYTQAGWYQYGPIPGNIGDAVIDGHVDNGGSIDGPFKHLSDVQIGDDIQIVGANGQTLHFTVTKTDVYSYKAFPSEDVFHSDEKNGAYLKIITCHGSFVKKDGTYDQRLVVTAILDK